jgi:hypothetical protein
MKHVDLVLHNYSLEIAMPIQLAARHNNRMGTYNIQIAVLEKLHSTEPNILELTMVSQIHSL